jgi:hypothetical protein
MNNEELNNLPRFMSIAETAKTRIKDYLNGRIAAIPELEEKRLRLDSKPDTEEAFGNSFRWMGYSGIATASRL